MPLVSAVIPTHNRARALPKALQSVLGQTHRDFEIVLVDDGSTDDTPSIMAGLADQDARVRFLRHESNRGAQAARNVGIRAARGEWIAFLDSDDWWLPNSLEVRLRMAADRKVEVVHSECYVLGRGNPMKPFGVPAVAGPVYRSLLARPGPVYPALLVARQALERTGYLDERIVSYQEWDVAIRLAKHYRFGFVEEPTFVYDCRGADTISKDMIRDARGYEQIVRKHAIAILSHLGPRALARHFDAAAARYRTAGDVAAQRRCRNQALVCWPLRPRLALRKLVNTSSRSAH